MSAYVKVGGELTVNATYARTQSNAEVTVLADGSYVVTWADGEHASGPRSVRAQLFTADGTRIGGELLLSDTSYMVADPAVVGLEGGVYDVELEEREKKKYRGVLDDGLRRLAEGGFTARGEVVTGEAIDEITKYARRIESDPCWMAWR